MSDPNDVWQESAPAPSAGGDRETRERSPRRERDRSRSPAPRNGDGGDDRRSVRDDRGPPPAEANQGNNLHVSGLAKSVDVPALEEVFGKIGKIYKVEIMQDPHTQESRGFGFVKMDTPEDAATCVEQLNGTPIDGKNITVAFAKRGRARTPTPGQYHGYKLDDRRPYDGGRGGYGGGGYRGGGGYDRPYQPRSYDSRYDRGPPRYDDRRYDDRRDDRPRYDDRRDERPRYDDRRDERPRYDDRRGDDRRGGDRRDFQRDERPRYDERPSNGGAGAV